MQVTSTIRPSQGRYRKGYPLKIFCTLFFLSTTLLGWAQAGNTRPQSLGEMIVRGRVATGPATHAVALPGATLQNLATRQSTTADGQGAFALPAAAGQSIAVSHTGYQSRRLTISADNPFLDIVLSPDSNSLQEVVVSSGYQQVSRRQSTGSVAVLSGTQLQKQVSTNLVDRLNGLVSGLQMDNNSARTPITIRGYSTIGGEKAPLVILNNLPYEGSLANINPNEVESITVLKDASAAAIWGVRAGNGVVVITTKKAKTHQPTQVSVSAAVTTTGKPNLDYTTPMTTSDFIEVEQYLYAKGYYDSQFDDFFKTELSPVVELLHQQTLGNLTADQVNTQLRQWRQQDVRKDFSRYVYGWGLNQQYALSLSGGGEKLGYRLSGSFDQNRDVLAATYQRVNLRTETNYQVMDKLRLTTSVMYTGSRSQSGKPGYGAIVLGGGTKGLYPYATLKTTDGSDNWFSVYRSAYTDTVGGGKLLDWRYNPLQDWQNNYTRTSGQDLLGSVQGTYQLRPWLSLQALYQFEHQTTATRQWRNTSSFYTRDIINRFSQLDDNSGQMTYIVPMGGILDESTSDLQSQAGRLQADWKKTWGRFSSFGLIGTELRQAHATSSSDRLYGYDEDKLTFANVDYVHSYPTFITGFYESIPSGRGRTDKTHRYVSQFANASVVYDDRFTLNGSIRKDGSNLFGVAANRKWTPLWSTGVRWQLDKERFFTSKAVDNLALRMSYGFQGNVSSWLSALTTLYYFGGAAYTNYPYAAITQFANPSLRWERVRQLNLGVDLSVWKNRLTASLDLYGKNGIDLYGNAPIDYTAGLGQYTVLKNVASTRGRGVDLNISGVLIDRKFKWTSTFLFAYNESLVHRYANNSVYGSQFMDDGSVITGLEGKPVYSILAYQWAGLDPQTGEPQGYYNKAVSKDYWSLTDDSVQHLVYSGSAVPTVFGSWEHTFSWKGLHLTMNLTYKLGYVFRRRSIEYDRLFSARVGHKDFAGRWQQPGDEKKTNVPAMTYPASYIQDFFYANAEVLVSPGDHIRLNFVNLSYDVLLPATRKSRVQQAQLYINMANGGVLWRKNKQGIDPDYANTLYAMPPPKSFSVGLRCTF